MIVTFFPTVRSFRQPIESSLIGKMEASRIRCDRGLVIA